MVAAATYGACGAVPRRFTLFRIIFPTAVIAWQKRIEPAVVPLSSGKTCCRFLAVYGSASPSLSEENPTRRNPPLFRAMNKGWRKMEGAKGKDATPGEKT